MSRTRRGLLGAVTVAGSLTTPPAWGAANRSDAKLIRICAEHGVNREKYEKFGQLLPFGESDILWDAYERTRDAISKARPVTMAGVRAKALAAKGEAQRHDGSEEPDGCPAAYWAWDLVNDLLRLGEGADVACVVTA